LSIGSGLGPRGTAQRAWLGDIKQAGGRQILIDQNGHTIYYGIHVNQAFADFIAANGLRTADDVKAADPSLFFPGGVVEFKSAWQEVDAADPTLARIGFSMDTLKEERWQHDKEMVEERAQSIAHDQVSRVRHSMALEDQRTGDEHSERQVAELRRKLLEGKRSRLWR
jgi:hypothetical protein